jgi:hypothetical protein
VVRIAILTTFFFLRNIPEGELHSKTKIRPVGVEDDGAQNGGGNDHQNQTTTTAPTGNPAAKAETIL